MLRMQASRCPNDLGSQAEHAAHTGAGGPSGKTHDVPDGLLPPQARITARRTDGRLKNSPASAGGWSSYRGIRAYNQGQRCIGTSAAALQALLNTFNYSIFPVRLEQPAAAELYFTRAPCCYRVTTAHRLMMSSTPGGTRPYPKEGHEIL